MLVAIMRCAKSALAQADWKERERERHSEQEREVYIQLRLMASSYQIFCQETSTNSIELGNLEHSARATFAVCTKNIHPPTHREKERERERAPALLSHRLWIAHTILILIQILFSALARSCSAFAD